VSTGFTTELIRSGIAAERKQFKEQKVEAEKYQKLSIALCQVTIKNVLLQLYHLEQDLASLDEKRSKRREKLSEMEKPQLVLLQQLKKEKKRQAQAHQKKSEKHRSE